jgi:hypothetical protein
MRGGSTPCEARLQTFPDAVVEKVPKVRGYKFFTAENRIAIADETLSARCNSWAASAARHLASTDFRMRILTTSASIAGAIAVRDVGARAPEAMPLVWRFGDRTFNGVCRVARTALGSRVPPLLAWD